MFCKNMAPTGSVTMYMIEFYTHYEICTNTMFVPMLQFEWLPSIAIKDLHQDYILSVSSKNLKNHHKMTHNHNFFSCHCYIGLGMQTTVLGVRER